jgi:hypothetical protein
VKRLPGKAPDILKGAAPADVNTFSCLPPKKKAGIG